MNEHQRKVMPRIEFQRIADDAVITQVWPDGTRQQLNVPLDQALILADWIVGSAEEHDRVANINPHPSPEEMAEMVAKRDPRPSLEEVAETGASAGCTRTAPPLSCVGRFRVVYDPTDLDEDEVYRHLAQLGISGEVTLETVVGLSDEEWPVSAIADGEVHRA